MISKEELEICSDKSNFARFYGDMGVLHLTVCAHEKPESSARQLWSTRTGRQPCLSS